MEKEKSRIVHLSKTVTLIAIFILLLGLTTLRSASFAREVEATGKQMANNVAAMDHFIRGVIADNMEDYYRAVFEYQEALEADSESPFIYVALAQDYVILGKIPQALDLLKTALEIDSNYIPALELLAGLLLNTDKWLDALEYYERLAELDTTEVEYPFQLLRLYIQKGNFDRADTMYQRVVAMEGESKGLLLQIATILLLGNNVHRATPYLERLAQLDSTDAAVIYTLGTLYLQRQDTALAQTHFERAPTLQPKIARYWMGLAILQMDMDDYTEACQTLERAVEAIPEDPGLWSLLGGCQNQAGMTEKAILSLQETLRLDTTNYSALGVLALTYDRLDSVQKVIELYERALQLSDSAVVFLNNYAYTLAERGMDLAHAKVMAEKACAAEPENASFLDTMGWVFFRLKDYHSAIHWLRKAMKSDPNNAPILEHLGDVYQDNGSKSKARKYYKKALKLDPESESLRRKLGL